MVNKRFRIATEIFVLVSRKVKNMNVKLVVVSILISATVWTLGNLVRPSTKEFQVAVKYVNPPKGLILLNRPDSLFHVELTAQGWDLLTSSVGSREAVPINISTLKPKLRGRFYTLTLPTVYFKKELTKQLKLDNVGNDMQPDSLHFVFDDLIEKRVPVKANLELQFESSYSKKGDIVLTPDSVTIKGPASEINTVEFVETTKEHYDHLDGSVDVLLLCQKPFENITLSHDEIVAHIDVDQFTEAALMVPVKVNCKVPGISIKTYPAELEIKYLVALRDFEQVVDTTFQIIVEVDSLSLLHKDPLIPQVKYAPEMVRNIRLSQETVDFVIVKE